MARSMDPEQQMEDLRKAMQATAVDAQQRGAALKAEAQSLLALAEGLLSKSEQLTAAVAAMEAVAAARPVVVAPEPTPEPAPEPRKPVVTPRQRRRETPPVRITQTEPEPKAEPEPKPRPAPEPEKPSVPDVRLDEAIKTDPRLKGEPSRSVGSKGIVTLYVAAQAARKLGRFNRRELAEELGLTGVGVGSWMTMLWDRGVMRAVEERQGRYEFVPSGMVVKPRVDPPKEPVEAKAEPTPEPEFTPEPEPEPVEVPVTRKPRVADQAWPENLATMPAAQGIPPKAQSIASAEFQRKVYDVAADGRANFVAAEIAKALGIDDDKDKSALARVAQAIRDLEGVGLVVRTGEKRHKAGKDPHQQGRKPWEFAVADGSILTKVEPTVEPEPEPEPEPAPEPIVKIVEDPQTAAEQAALVTLREFAEAQPDLFSPGQAAEATELPRALVDEVIKVMVRGMLLVDESPAPDLPLYRFNPPTTPEEAKKLDAERRRAARGGQPKRGAPVAGTGRGLKIDDPRVRELVERCLSVGAKVEHATNGHLLVTHDDLNRRHLISHTPKTSRSVQNDETRLRRGGLKI